MADVSVTAANVAPILTGSNPTQIENGIFGATVTAGQLVYLDTTTNTYKLCDANASALTSVLRGVALNGGVSGQPAAVGVGGTYTCGFTATAGAIYVASATAGGIAPTTDLGAGVYTSILGVALTTAIMQLRIINSGVTG